MPCNHIKRLLMSSYLIPDMTCVGWVSGLSTEPQQMEAGPGDEVKMSRETQAKVAALRYSTYGGTTAPSSAPIHCLLKEHST